MGQIKWIMMEASFRVYEPQQTLELVTYLGTDLIR